MNTLPLALGEAQPSLPNWSTWRVIGNRTSLTRTDTLCVSHVLSKIVRARVKGDLLTRGSLYMLMRAAL